MSVGQGLALKLEMSHTTYLPVPLSFYCFCLYTSDTMIIEVMEIIAANVAN